MGKREQALTITEAAEALGITRQAVYAAIERGSMKARDVKVVRRVIPMREVERYRRENLGQVKPGPGRPPKDEKRAKKKRRESEDRG